MNAQGPSDTLSTLTLHVRCPHCHSSVRVVADDPLTDLICSSCGTHFWLVSGESTRTHATSPRQMGQFDLLECVGVGHYGSVWKARDRELDRIIAIKIPRREQLSPVECEQFLREARAAAQLKHPNIVSIHEVGRDGTSLYIVSDFVDGVNLREWLSVRRLTIREAAELCAKLADALHHAHEAGVVHRDLKPGNIMLDHSGTPYITDFGLAKREGFDLTITVDGEVLGTPAYMSPEQARGKAHEADRRADVYALGVLLYELITGELPFRGDHRMLLKQILHDEPKPPHRINSRVPRDLETICLRCLEKDPSRRYATAAELAEDLQRYLTGRPIQARPIGRVGRLWRWGRRNPIIAGLLAAIFITLSTGAVASTFFALESAKQARAARTALYYSYLRESDALRAARVQGYLDQVRQLVIQAARIKTSAVDRTELRRHLIAAMGDFVGFSPRTLNGFPQAIGAATISPSGEELIIGCDDGSLWQCDLLGGGGRVALATPHQNSISSIEYVARAAQLVTVDSQGLVQSWTRRGVGIWQPKQSFQIEGADRLLIAREAEAVIALKADLIEVWDLAEQQPWLELPIPGLKPTSAVLDAKRSRLYFTYTDEIELTFGLAVADTQQKQILRDAMYDLGQTYPRSLTLSPDERLLAVGFDQALLVCESEASRDAQLLQEEEDFKRVMFKRWDATKAVAFSPDNQWLAAVDIRGRITIWNVHTDREIATLHNWRTARSRECLEFSQQGRYLLATNATQARIWDLKAAPEKLTLTGHDGAVPAAAFTPDGELLVSCGKDGFVKFWEGGNGQPIGALKIIGDVQALCFDPKGELLAVGSWWRPGEGLALVDVSSREIVLDQKHPVTYIYSLAFFRHEKRKYLAASGETGVALWEVRDDQGELSLHEPPGWRANTERSVCVAASPDGRWLAWVKNDEELVVWDMAHSHFETLGAPKLNQGWHGLAFLPDGERLVYISDSNQAVVWDIRQDRRVFTLGTPGQFRAPHLALAPHGRWLAGLHNSDVVSIWDTRGREHLFSFRSENSPVYSLAWSPQGQRLAVGLSDGGLFIWDLDRVRSAAAELELGWHE